MITINRKELLLFDKKNMSRRFNSFYSEFLTEHQKRLTAEASELRAAIAVLSEKKQKLADTEKDLNQINALQKLNKRFAFSFKNILNNNFND